MEPLIILLLLGTCFANTEIYNLNFVNETDIWIFVGLEEYNTYETISATIGIELKNDAFCDGFFGLSQVCSGSCNLTTPLKLGNNTFSVRTLGESTLNATIKVVFGAKRVYPPHTSFDVESKDMSGVYFGIFVACLLCFAVGMCLITYKMSKRRKSTATPPLTVTNTTEADCVPLDMSDTINTIDPASSYELGYVSTSKYTSSS